MKTLTKQNLEAMVDKLPVLTEVEQRSVIGGCNCTPDAKYCPNSGACFDSGQWIAGQGWIKDITGTYEGADTGAVVQKSKVTGAIFQVDANGVFRCIGPSDNLVIIIGEENNSQRFSFKPDAATITVEDGSTTIRGRSIDNYGLFETLSDKTDVEWGMAAKTKGTDFVLTTSHKTDAVTAKLPSGGDGGWDSLFHNHKSVGKASKLDEATQKSQALKGYTNFGIYNEADGEYYLY